MIAVDTSILVYSHRIESPFHTRAAEVVAALAEGRASWAIPWPCLHEFYAVATNRRAFEDAAPMRIAVATVDAWLKSPSLRLIHETETHWDVLRGLVAGASVVGPAVHDARIAAICLENGVSELWTADRDFARFPVRVRNPLAG